MGTEMTKGRSANVRFCFGVAQDAGRSQSGGKSIAVKPLVMPCV